MPRSALLLRVALVIALLGLFVLESCTRSQIDRGNAEAIEVVTMLDGTPVEGVAVGFFRSPEDFPKAPLTSSVSDKEGTATVNLPGVMEAYLFAWKPLEDGKVVFGYFGGNPIYPSSGRNMKLYLPLVRYRGLVSRTPAEAPIIEGIVVERGEPLSDCYVFAFVDDSSGFRDPNDATMSLTDEAGRFEMEVPPGKYFLVARKRKSGSFAGPLEEGDRVGYFPGNPIDVRDGEAVEVEIPVVTLKMRNERIFERKGVASIEGVIVDETGNPVEGIYAALYDNPDLLNRPVVISPETGPDGKFVIHVPRSGKFYLGARTGYGGAPAPGDLYGRYEGTPDHSIVVREGDEIRGIVITVTEVW